MQKDPNTDTNQTPSIIRLPDNTQGVENATASGQTPDPQPDEHVPPVEVPGREETPEHVPEKARRRKS